MTSLKDDTNTVREEFDAISTPTQIFIACLVALGFLGGGALGYALAVDELDEGDPAQCIEYQSETYCLNGAPEDAEE